MTIAVLGFALEAELDAVTVAVPVPPGLLCVLPIPVVPRLPNNLEAAFTPIPAPDLDVEDEGLPATPLTLSALSLRSLSCASCCCRSLSAARAVIPDVRGTVRRVEAVAIGSRDKGWSGEEVDERWWISVELPIERASRRSGSASGRCSDCEERYQLWHMSL